MGSRVRRASVDPYLLNYPMAGDSIRQRRTHIDQHEHVGTIYATHSARSSRKRTECLTVVVSIGHIQHRAVGEGKESLTQVDRFLTQKYQILVTPTLKI